MRGMPSPQHHTFWYHLFDVLINIVVIVLIVMAIRTFLVSPFQVEGSSMIDTLYDKEYIIINKFTYITGTPHRGDVVVFRPPSDPGKYYVKRVIGQPGEHVMLKDGDVFIKTATGKDFQKLDESSYLNPHNLDHTFRHPPASGDTSAMVYDIPPDHYFVLGDNRQGSLDSRSFMSVNGKPIPYVETSAVKGRVWFVALPVTKIHALETPNYRM